MVQDALDRLDRGQGGTLILTGEPGAGKSRLVTEIRHRRPVGSLMWLEGRAVSFGRSLSYWPFIEILKSCFDIGEDDAEDETWRKLSAGLVKTHRCNQVAQMHGRSAPIATRLHDPLHAGEGRLHALCKRHVVKLRVVALHKVHARRCMFAKVAYFAFAVRGQRANGNQPRLQAGDKTKHQFVAIAELEHNAV